MALLQPDVRRIGRPHGPPAPDRAPDWVAGGTPEPLRSELVALLGADRVLSRPLDLVRYASDASPYRRIPKVVVMARDAQDVRRVFEYARRTGTPVTLRAAGTSLNGQAQGDGIMVDVRRHWAGVAVEEDGLRARVRPGTVLGHANRVLAPHGRKLGPDPASTDAATVGGVIANNSGGMRCGVEADSYRTLRSLTFVLASGTTIDTAAPGAQEAFAAAEPELAGGLAALRDELRADAELSERVRRKFEIKNTTGYRLCALLDADTPLEIFRRLLVGSEGTLGFIAEAVFDTVPQPAHTTVAWLHFESIDAAVAPVPDLVAAGASAVELMVAPALITASHMLPGTPAYWQELAFESAALLVELGADDAADLDPAIARATKALAGHELLREPGFTRDPEEIEVAWRVREGMFGLVGKLRPEGTSLIGEDVCVRPERIAESARDIQALLGKHGFLTGVAGHASAGNLHFMLTPALGDAADRERYEAFMSELVDLIVDRYDGSLKAEHGTGVNMAPYVEREWGAKATEMMWRIKALADPDGVLGPGVVLNRDPGVHLRDLKTQPPIEEEATTCVECGFCEPVCPSRNVTTTPRQRIVLRREMARQPEGSPVLDALLRDYEHDAIQTCAADGTCGPACPVAIDTGKLIKRFRALEHTDRAESLALAAAKRWAAVERAARAGLRAGDAARAIGRPDGRGGEHAAATLGDRALAGAAGVLRGALGEELVPSWPANMPPPAPAAMPATARDGAAAVYLPACINRIFGNPRGAPPRPSLPEALVSVSARAGLPVWIPDDAAGHCCATPWASKGYARGHEHMARKVADALWRWSDEGRLPVVIDATSCAQGLLADVPSGLDDAARERYERVTVMDSIAWAHDRLLPELEVRRRARAVAVHPTCSAGHLGLEPKLEALAGALADEVVVPVGAACCGFAGDRGLLHPEIPPSALREEAESLDGRAFDAHLCANRTCEIGLQQVTGRPYASFVFLLEEATRP
jgi:D-lactate dehydrogenase